MRRLLSWSLILLACCLLVTPGVGCGSKKGPATIQDLLAKAKQTILDDATCPVMVIKG